MPESMVMAYLKIKFKKYKFSGIDCRIYKKMYTHKDVTPDLNYF
jgi:hypothetical protein